MDESQGRGTAAPVSPADRALAECFAGAPFELLTRADRIVARANTSQEKAHARIKRAEAERDELLAVVREFQQLITNDSDDNGFHLNVVPIRYQLKAAIAAAIAKFA